MHKNWIPIVKKLCSENSYRSVKCRTGDNSISSRIRYLCRTYYYLWLVETQHRVHEWYSNKTVSRYWCDNLQHIFFTFSEESDHAKNHLGAAWSHVNRTLEFLSRTKTVYCRLSRRYVHSGLRCCSHSVDFFFRKHLEESWNVATPNPSSLNFFWVEFVLWSHIHLQWDSVKRPSSWILLLYFIQIQINPKYCSRICVPSRPRISSPSRLRNPNLTRLM